MKVTRPALTTLLLSRCLYRHFDEVLCMAQLPLYRKRRKIYARVGFIESYWWNRGSSFQTHTCNSALKPGAIVTGVYERRGCLEVRHVNTSHETRYLSATGISPPPWQNTSSFKCISQSPPMKTLDQSVERLGCECNLIRIICIFIHTKPE